MSTKYCPDCRRDLPVGDFTKNRRSKDGLAFYCAPCARTRHVASRRKRDGPPKNRSALRPTDVPPDHKWCPECDAIKPLVEFARNRSTKNGFGAYCRPCHNRVTQASREANGGSRNYHLRRRYGIGVEHFDQMFAEQNGKCAICREADAVHLDHDHATGRVRGLLCFNCNQALGNFRDRGDLMLLAIHYLERGATATYQRPPGATVAFALGFDEVPPEAAA